MTLDVGDILNTMQSYSSFMEKSSLNTLLSQTDDD